MVSNSSLIQLINKIEQFDRIPIGFASKILPFLEELTVKKDVLLLKAGQSPKNIWFLLEGTLREITKVKSTVTDETTWFWYNSDFVYAPFGCFTHHDSLTAIEVVEDSKLLVITLENFLKLFQESDFLVQITEKIREYYGQNRFLHTIERKWLRGQDRYDNLFGEHPRLFNIAKKKDLASFLGVKDDSFYRFTRKE